MEVCNDLVQLARKRGGPDNITVQVLRVRSKPLISRLLPNPPEFPSLD